jgi:hypothetical protein
VSPLLLERARVAHLKERHRELLDAAEDAALWRWALKEYDRTGGPEWVAEFAHERRAWLAGYDAERAEVERELAWLQPDLAMVAAHATRLEGF